MSDYLLAGHTNIDDIVDEGTSETKEPLNYGDFERIIKLFNENDKELYEKCSEFTHECHLLKENGLAGC